MPWAAVSASTWSWGDEQLRWSGHRSPFRSSQAGFGRGLTPLAAHPVHHECGRARIRGAGQPEGTTAESLFSHRCVTEQSGEDHGARLTVRWVWTTTRPAICEIDFDFRATPRKTRLRLAGFYGDPLILVPSRAIRHEYRSRGSLIPTTSRSPFMPGSRSVSHPFLVPPRMEFPQQK